MAKLFYVKYDVSSGSLIIDQSKVKQSYDELLVNNYKITKTQAKLLKDAITDRFLYKDRAAFLSEVEWEFNRLFHVCSSCNFVTTRSKVNKAWDNRCQRCFRKVQEEKRRANQANKDYRKQIRKYKEHMTTPQGRVDAIPISIIESNVRFEMIRRNISSTDMANALGISPPSFSKLFKNNTIDYKALQSICEVLIVPPEKMLRLHRGVRVPRKDGVPRFWLDEGFRITKY
ncbi:MAG TPA: helix-turn-helix transcriptional regulator [Epulopiscium sp.]|nr:helix-turn-helix transcriptional regulator [Candidatus Epulonipiscium sp.]